MQKNHQSDKQFLQEIGALLAARAGQERTPPPPAMSHLADYVTSARHHQKLTRAALAQKMGESEAEIYALEQGLLSYAEIDLRFLSKLAVALNEDMETFLLLLGRPALAQALQRQDVVKQQEQAPKLVCQRSATGSATVSKPRGNSFRHRQWKNALRKGCLNLIDSWQQGRLSSTISVNFQVYSVAVMVVCLFLIGVSSYSLAGRFGAQSEVQSGMMMAAQPDARTPTPVQRGPGYSSIQGSRRLYWTPESITQAVTVSIDGPTTTVALKADPTMIEAQQCYTRAVGRFALCRV